MYKDLTHDKNFRTLNMDDLKSTNHFPFSIVLPVKSKSNLLEKSLTSCYSVNPDEVLICLDDPPDKKILDEIKRISNKYGYSHKTKIITVQKNLEFSFHQAWVRREGFRQAKHDRILTVDVDLIINNKVLKALSLVGKDNVGFVSCSTAHSKNGLLGVWRHIAFKIANKKNPPQFTGLYALWRPYWLDTEDEKIKSLENARKAKGGFALIGEDTYLHNCMQTKYKCMHLSDYGADCMRDDCNDLPDVQFEIGRHYTKKIHNISIIVKIFNVCTFTNSKRISLSKKIRCNTSYHRSRKISI